MPKFLGPYFLAFNGRGKPLQIVRLRRRRLAELRARKMVRLGYSVVLTIRHETVIYSGGPSNG